MPSNAALLGSSARTPSPRIRRAAEEGKRTARASEPVAWHAMDVRAREPIILAADYDALVAWYCEALGFRVVRRFEEGYHYSNLESGAGVKVGIASAAEAGIAPGDRSRNTVVLQLEVNDLKEFFAHLEARGARITGAPSYDAKGSFWFGSFADPEGNPFWVVDRNCP